MLNEFIECMNGQTLWIGLKCEQLIQNSCGVLEGMIVEFIRWSSDLLLIAFWRRTSAETRKCICFLRLLSLFIFSSPFLSIIVVSLLFRTKWNWNWFNKNLTSQAFEEGLLGHDSFNNMK